MECDIPAGSSRGETASTFLLRGGRRDIVFVGQLERHVSSAAGTKHRYPSGAGAVAWAGIQYHLHPCFLACGMGERPFLALMDRRRRLPDLRGSLFCVRASAVHNGYLDCDGGLWSL